MTPNLALFGAAALAVPAPALAATADLTAIDRQVAAFTGASQGTPGGAVLPVDRRLRLAPCALPLTVNWHTSRKESVLVQCPDAGSWRLFVPVKPPVGGSAAAIEPPAITRGEAVTVSVRGDGFAVSQPGIAVDQGSVGGWVRVKMLQGGAPKGDAMRAQVIRPGLVAIPLE